MKVVDLHPEELLDKEARGELTELESERLEAHLARCATCRFEREVRADFAAELDEDDGLPSQRVTALVDGLPRTRPAPIEHVVEEEAPPATRPRRVGRKNARVLLLIAAALFVGSIATAGIGGRVWERFTGSNGEEATVTPPSPPQATTALAVAPSASASEHVFLEHDEAAAASAVPVAPVAIVAAEVVPTENAATLFEAASEARRRGDYAQALGLHRRLQTQYASSREAHASQASVGRLLLDRGDPTGALASFDAYQKRGTGSFDEPVMVGRATALERLGRTDDARDAWRALVTAFPDTPWRSHAESRLATTATATP